MMTKLDKTRAIWHRVPDTLQVAIWVGISAGATAVITYLLERPEYFEYYGLLNILLFAIKEIGKSIEKK